MSDTSERELDRRISDLVAAAVADAPHPPDAATITVAPVRPDGERGVRWGLWAAVGAVAAAAALVVFPGLGDETLREVDPNDRPPITNSDPSVDIARTTPPATTAGSDSAEAILPPVTAAAPTTTPSSTSPVEAEPICTGGLDGRAAAERFAEAIVVARETGEFEAVSDCLDEIPAVYSGETPACWTVCENSERVIDSEFATYGDVGDAVGNWSWFTRLPVSYTTAEGDSIDVIESWRFVPGDDRHRVDGFSIDAPLSQRGPSLVAITRYFENIASGDWGAAATMLDDGAVNWDERTDLDELGVDLNVATLDDLADALEQWCNDGCDTEPPTADELTFTGRYGITRNDRRIEARLFEGTYSMVGLPIPLDNDQENP